MVDDCEMIEEEVHTVYEKLDDGSTNVIIVKAENEVINPSVPL